MDYLTKTNLPTILLCLVATRSVLFGSHIGDSIVLVGLAGLFAFTFYLESRSKEQTEDIKSQIEAIRNEVSSMKLNNTVLRKPNEQKKQQDPTRRWF